MYDMMVRLLAQWVLLPSPSPLHLSVVCRVSGIPHTKGTEPVQQTINSGYNNQEENVIEFLGHRTRTRDKFSYQLHALTVG